MTTYTDILIADGDVIKTALELENSFASIQIKYTDVDEAVEVHVLGSVDGVDYAHIPDFQGEPTILILKGSGGRLLPLLGLDGVPFIKIDVKVKDAKTGTINYIKVY